MLTRRRLLRAGAGADDPFTTLAPRQPITDTPSAVNARFAVNAANAERATRATNAGTNVVAVGLCFKLDDGAVTNFAPGSTDTVVDDTYKIYSVSATVVPGAGSARFGLCVGKNSQPPLSNNVNGWLMVTRD